MNGRKREKARENSAMDWLAVVEDVVQDIVTQIDLRIKMHQYFWHSEAVSLVNPGLSLQ